ncbi:biotin transporter BioY [Cohnella panacarvi]|uniref:biotin transporter BioY n=1 Tax=Cohnella panacarvi TaxID=400776 RepID=UPI00047BB3F8|nr:biotin transporter BioY [Cohnella panacarvi]
MSNPITTTNVNSRANTSEWIRGIVFTALFGALFIAGSYIKFRIGFSTVPITLQTFAVILAGGLLGATYGFMSIFIVILLTALGLPLMGEGSGLSKMTGASAGFIWMFPIAAFLLGWICDKLFAGRSRLTIVRLIVLFLSTFLIGSLLLYVTGAPWLAHYLHWDLDTTLRKGIYVYLPGDVLKSVAGAIVIAALRPVLPKIRPSK